MYNVSCTMSQSVYSVAVAAGQPCGLPCSVTLFSPSSIDSHDTSIPVCLFSPLAPAHLVSMIQFSVPSGVG